MLLTFLLKFESELTQLRSSSMTRPIVWYYLQMETDPLHPGETKKSFMDFMQQNSTMALRFSERSQRVRNYCRKSFIAYKRLQDTVSWTNVREKWTYCAISKVGSTTWYQDMLTLKGLGLDDVRGKFARHKMSELLYPTPENFNAARDTEDFFSFVFVRHPLDRLVSGYYGKIVDPTGFRQSRKFELLRLTFSQRIELRDKATLTPTQFIQGLVDAHKHFGIEGMNKHFRPQYTQCGFCLTDFDVIGKMETFDEDRFAVLKVIDQDDILNATSHENGSKESKRDLRAEFLQSVPQHLLHELDKIYRLDFEIFGYSGNFSSWNKAIHNSIISASLRNLSL